MLNCRSILHSIKKQVQLHFSSTAVSSVAWHICFFFGVCVGRGNNVTFSIVTWQNLSQSRLQFWTQAEIFDPDTTNNPVIQMFQYKHRSRYYTYSFMFLSGQIHNKIMLREYPAGILVHMLHSDENIMTSVYLTNDWREIFMKQSVCRQIQINLLL